MSEEKKVSENNNAEETNQTKSKGEVESLIKALKEKEELIKEKEQEITGLKIEIVKLQEKIRKEGEILSREAERKANKSIGELILALLEVLDNFERALSASNADNCKSVDGLVLIKNQIEKILTSYGVNEIEVENKPYDPNLCEIGEVVEAEDYEPNVVLKVLRKGYLMNGKLLRTAIVSVAVPKKDNIQEVE